MTVTRHLSSDSAEDILRCSDCGERRRLPRRQTVVLTQVHRCDGDPAWFVPEYVRPIVSRRRKERPAA